LYVDWFKLLTNVVYICTVLEFLFVMCTEKGRRAWTLAVCRTR